MRRFVLYLAAVVVLFVVGQMVVRTSGMPADTALLIGWFIGWMSCTVRDLLLTDRADG